LREAIPLLTALHTSYVTTTLWTPKMNSAYNWCFLLHRLTKHSVPIWDQHNGGGFSSCDLCSTMFPVEPSFNYKEHSCAMLAPTLWRWNIKAAKKGCLEWNRLCIMENVEKVITSVGVCCWFHKSNSAALSF